MIIEHEIKAEPSGKAPSTQPTRTGRAGPLPLLHGMRRGHISTGTFCCRGSVSETHPPAGPAAPPRVASAAAYPGP